MNTLEKLKTVMIDRYNAGAIDIVDCIIGVFEESETSLELESITIEGVIEILKKSKTEFLAGNFEDA